MYPRHFPLLLIVPLLAATAHTPAADKNGVSPQAISLPSGPGSIQGLGESFQPQLNTGGATYAIPLVLPRGTAGHSPSLELSYNSGASNGVYGLGWTLGGVVSVSRNLDQGVPRYVDTLNGLDDDGDGVVDNPEEIDVFSGLDREELVPLADGTYRAESESAFTRYERSGQGWIAHRRDGTRFELGLAAEARIEDSGRVFSWLIERIVDTDDNAISFTYFSSPDAPAQKYLHTIRWGQPSAYFMAVLSHEAGRPDPQVDLRSGFEVRTALRVTQIDVVSQGIPSLPGALRQDFDQDGRVDSLVRRWTLEYQPDAAVSLLGRVTQRGIDGQTALPPVTLEYTQWVPPTNVAALVIPSKGEPAENLSSGSVELCDMNGDSLPDLLSTSGNQHRVSINLGMTPDGKLEWAPPVPVGNAPTIDIASSTAHLADSTADGLSDLVVKVSNTRFVCFDNTSKTSWTAASAPLRNTDTWPIWPFDGANGTSSRSMDTDHNRRNDVLFTSNSGYGLWLLLPQGQYAREIRMAPLTCEGQVFRFDLPGTHIADLNGDRLQDLVWVQPSRLAWFPNLGRDHFGACRVVPIQRTLTAQDLEKTGFSDLDGDGLEDLTVVRPASDPRSVMYWLNRFENGFDGPRRLDGLPAQQSGDTLRWADMNGNGSSDIVISNSARPAGSRLLVVDLLPAAKPHLLAAAANGLGLVTRLEHETSADQMVRARREGTPWSSVMQISVPVVRRIVEDDSRGNLNTREITYRDPFWNAEKQEFRGFKNVQLREVGDSSSSDQLVRHRFDAGEEADCLKGKLLLDETLDETGKVFLRNENTWTRRQLAVGIDARVVCHAFISSVDTTHVEGIDTAITTRVETDYDAFGNVVLNRNLGDIDVSGDEVVEVSEYEVRQDTWILNLPLRKAVLDGEGRRVSEERFAHDSRGRLIRRESWLDKEDRFIVTSRTTYDSFGNPVEQIDALGHRRTIEYDPLIHALATVERVHLEDDTLTLSAEYDLGLGVVLRATDFSGAETSAAYDALGRIVELRPAGGARRTFEYHLGNPVSHVAESELETAGGDVYRSFAFSDGYGRKLSRKVEAEDGKWRLLDAVRYNARKLVEKSWLPLERESPDFEEPAETDRHDVESYDALGRLIRTVHPDGSTSLKVYEPLLVHEHDENDTAGRGAPKTTRRDGLGRVVQILERNGAQTFSTHIAWSPRGDLLEIKDSKGNTRSFTHDSLRRCIRMDDPNRGARQMFYDDGDNLIRTLDARGQVSNYEYDLADRLLREVHQSTSGGPDGEVVYSYDAPQEGLDLGNGESRDTTFTRGRLSSVVDASGETHFSYDERGNTLLTLKRIKEPRTGLLVSYATRFQYDLMDRVVGITYPDEDSTRFVHGTGNFVERIDGGPGGLLLLRSSRHHPTGQVREMELGNGVRTTHSFDSRDRLSTLVTTAPGGDRLVDNEYRYDPTSHVTHIIDRRPFAAIPRDSARRNTQVFAYDDLDRLVSARYAQPDDLSANLGQIDYGYDEIGNLVRKSTPPEGQKGHIDHPGLSLGTLVYGSGQSANRNGRLPGEPPGPNAVTSTSSGRTFEYDPSGNMTRRDGATLGWDAKDQLISFVKGTARSEYVYDYSDRRVARVVTNSDRRSDETIYVNQYYEERPGRTPVKYVFADGARIARVEGNISASANRLQRIRLASGWNTVAIAVSVEKTFAATFGQDSAVYTWTPAGFERLSGNLVASAGRPLWVHVPTTRLVTLNGVYAPETTPLDIPVGGALVAWDRLEALVPSRHLSRPARIFHFDADSSRWLLEDSGLPSFLRDFAAQLPSAGAVWIDAPADTRLEGAAREAEAVTYSHADHLGSAAATTDRLGALTEEIAYFPFGEIRNRYSPTSGSSSAEYTFTGKEIDMESGLSYLGARFYDPVLGRFLSVDPLLGNPSALEPGQRESFLLQPQKHNLYSYVLNDPLKYVDPDGLDNRTTVQRTPAEAKAYFDDDAGIDTMAYYSKPTPRTTSQVIDPRNGNYKTAKSSDLWRAGWRQVTVQLTVKGPDGKPVRNHFVTVGFSGKNGLSSHAVRTDASGKATFLANVPARGGQISARGAFDDGDRVRAADAGLGSAFDRGSGESKLNFQIRVKTSVVHQKNGPDVENAKLDITQTRGKGWD